MFLDNLKRVTQEAILFVVKWGIVAAAIILFYNFSNNTYNMAINGQQAAIAIREFQNKGWLPKLNSDGTVNPKLVEEKNATP